MDVNRRGDILELSSLHNQPEVSVYEICRLVSQSGMELFILTDNVARGFGIDAAKFIEDIGFAKVVAPPSEFNPNSNNQVQVFMCRAKVDRMSEYIEVSKKFLTDRGTTAWYLNLYKSVKQNLKEHDVMWVEPEQIKMELPKEKPKGIGYKTMAGATRGIGERAATHKIVERDGLYRIVKR